MIRSPDDVTAAVLAVMEQTTDPRLREIMVALIEHIHGFVRDVGLTEDEFRAATTLLNQIGQASTDSHNEAVLLAGSLGVSSLVCLHQQRCRRNGRDDSEPTRTVLAGRPTGHRRRRLDRALGDAG